MGAERECFALGGGAGKGDERRQRGRRRLCESGVGEVGEAKVEREFFYSVAPQAKGG